MSLAATFRRLTEPPVERKGWELAKMRVSSPFQLKPKNQSQVNCMWREREKRESIDFFRRYFRNTNGFVLFIKNFDAIV